MVYRFMSEHRRKYTIREMAGVLDNMKCLP
jgi:hypothetical protein